LLQFQKLQKPEIFEENLSVLEVFLKRIEAF